MTDLSNKKSAPGIKRDRYSFAPRRFDVIKSDDYTVSGLYTPTSNDDSTPSFDAI